jgi:hypothetical protein
MRTLNNDDDMERFTDMMLADFLRFVREGFVDGQVDPPDDGYVVRLYRESRSGGRARLRPFFGSARTGRPWLG